MPIEWWLSRICEEFNCLPSQALREWQEAPAGLLEGILEARAYAHAKSIVDSAKKATDIPKTPMTDLVKVIEHELAKRSIDEQSLGS